MLNTFLSTSLSVTLLLAPLIVNADVVTLYLPDTTPIAMSADILGTDDAGRTTWRLSPGQPSGTLSVVDFPVATLVEGPNDVHSFQDKGDFVVSDDCTIKDGVAACSALVSSSAGIETILSTETVSAKAFEVQVTGIPKNSASRMVGSASLAVPVLVMWVAYSLVL